MAPIRRYLRITKYSVLECRIYVDDPAIAESWLLNPRDPVLPRVIESVRPLVLPKLREENERKKGKGKKKGVKDVVVEDDFEVSIFLTETSTRHSLLTKHKHFRDKDKKGLVSNSQKLTGGDTNDTAIEVEDAHVVIREESDDEEQGFQEIPAVEINDSDSDDSLFVADDASPRGSKRTAASPPASPLPKRRKDGAPDEEAGDDKKKMAMDTTYDGFAIYGRVLCLVVKRKDRKGKGRQVPDAGVGQATMENWITSTQVPDLDDEV